VKFVLLVFDIRCLQGFQEAQTHGRTDVITEYLCHHKTMWRCRLVICFLN